MAIQVFNTKTQEGRDDLLDALGILSEPSRQADAARAAVRAKYPTFADELKAAQAEWEKHPGLRSRPVAQARKVA